MDDHRIDISVGCIPRIPESLRAEKSRAYVPQTVSLGPFHYRSKPQLDEYEITIKRDLPWVRFCVRDQQFEELVHGMINDQQFICRIRQWYALSDSVPGDKELCEMMATDGFFLLQFLREFSGEYGSRLMSLAIRYTDPKYKPLQESFAVQEDIMKLENRIPVFALQRILRWELATLPDLHQEIIKDLESRSFNSRYQDIKFNRCHVLEWVLGAGQDLSSALRLAWHSLCPFPDMRDRQDSHVSAGDALTENSHLLEFLYENIIRSSHSTDRTKCDRRKKQKKKSWGITLPAAAELKKKGVMFAANVKVLDRIRFDGKTGTFHLPKAEISNRTVVLMENLVAFEALARKDETKPLRTYVDLMDCLINTSADVDVLIDSGIIDEFSHPYEVANAWKGIGEGLDKGEYDPIHAAIDDVTTFYVNYDYRMMYAGVKEKYFPRAWLVLSSIIGCILLISSVLQTIFAWKQLRLQQESMKNV